MMELLVCLLQVTMIAVVAFVAARMFLARAPHLSAHFCWLGLFLSAAVVVATVCDVPRLWTLDLANQTTHSPAPLSTEISAGDDVAVVNNGAKQQSRSQSFSVTIRALLTQLSQLPNKESRIQTTLVHGYWWMAALLGLIILGRCLVGGWWIWNLRKAQEVCAQSALHQELQRLGDHAGVRFAVRLRVCEPLASPCVSWLSRGTIYVPADFAQWAPAERAAALAHELVHELRRDAQWRLLADLCLSAVCCHPLLLLLRRRLVFAQELATDRDAADLLGGKNRYRRGLSLLALRVDSQQTASFLVSVSTNDVIRRIKMMKPKHPSLRRWQEATLLAGMLAVCGLAMAWTARADEPVRVASRTSAVTASVTTANLVEPILPWEELGERDGYMVLRPSILAKDPTLHALYEAHIGEALSSVDLDAVGLQADNIRSLQLRMGDLTVAEIPEADRNDDGHANRGSVSFDGILVETIDPVAWKTVGEQLRHIAGSQEQFDILQAELTRSNNTRELRLINHTIEDSDHKPSKALHRVWEQVSQCAAVWALAGPRELATETDMVEGQALLESVEAAAVGIDPGPATGTRTICIALAPRPGYQADAVQQLAEATHAKLLTWGQAAVAALTTDDDQEQTDQLGQLLDDLSAPDFDVVKTTDGQDVLVIRASTTASFPDFGE